MVIYVHSLIVFVFVDVRKLPCICFLSSHSDTLWFKPLYNILLVILPCQSSGSGTEVLFYFTRPQCCGFSPFCSTDTGQSQTSLAFVAESWVFSARVGCRCSLNDNRIPKDRSCGFIWEKKEKKNQCGWTWLLGYANHSLHDCFLY